MDVRQLPQSIEGLANSTKEVICNVLKQFFTELLQDTQSRTRFSFQRWRFEFIDEIDKVHFVIYLPFESGSDEVPYTSNVWNNPYFSYRLKSGIHQPLQEAMIDHGLEPSPTVGVPIKPVPWPTAPETVVEIKNPNKLLEIVLQKMEEEIKRILG